MRDYLRTHDGEARLFVVLAAVMPFLGIASATFLGQPLCQCISRRTDGRGAEPTSRGRSKRSGRLSIGGKT